MKPKAETKNLFIELAKRKSEAKKKGSNFLDASQSSRFRRPTSEPPQALRGSRNGQGKPG